MAWHDRRIDSIFLSLIRPDTEYGFYAIASRVGKTILGIGLYHLGQCEDNWDSEQKARTDESLLLPAVTLPKGKEKTITDQKPATSVVYIGSAPP